MQTLKFYILIVALAVALGSCEKDAGVPADLAVPTTDAARQIASCDALVYSDTIYYVSDQNKNYIVTPKKSSAGTYSASPAGLQINASSGAINISASETGLRYKVVFVPSGTNDTCSRYITISGVDYQSAVYSLSSKDTLATPTYYGKSKIGVPTGSEFDNGTTDPTMRSLGVDVDPLTGKINLKKSSLTKLFGGKPSNGASRIVTLYYRLNDDSKKSLNKINIKFVYYARPSDVPADMAAPATTKNARAGVNPTSGASLPAAYATGATREPRPPVIVVTA